MSNARNLANLSSSTSNGFTFRNKIINGDMRINQRGFSGTINSNTTFTLDRWCSVNSTSGKFSIAQNAGSVTPPSGFTNYLGCTSLSAYSVPASEIFTMKQTIEGFNVADLSWGTSNAKTITVSAWVYSSLTGTFGGAIVNSDANRSYPFTYTIPTANTWTQISVVIPGDTTGTWLKDNGQGINLHFSLGTGTTYSGTAGSWAGTFYASATGATSVVGTSGATLYITGVQLEKGLVATPFEYRQYGTELALCQRYYYNTMWIRDANSLTAPTNTPVELQGARHQFGDVTGYRGQAYNHPVLMRATPTLVTFNANNGGATGQWYFYAHNGGTQNFSGTASAYRDNIKFVAYTGVSVGASGASCEVWAHWSASAEL